MDAERNLEVLEDVLLVGVGREEHDDAIGNNLRRKCANRAMTTDRVGERTVHRLRITRPSSSNCALQLSVSNAAGRAKTLAFGRAD